MLVTRYWPRGVARDRVDAYVPKLAPSRELLRAPRDGRLAWSEFAKRYRQEMRGPDQRDEIRRWTERAAAEAVTLMCVCESDDRCHRRVLAGLMRRRASSA